MTVYLVTTGDGSDGNEWNVEGIYATRQLAEEEAATWPGNVQVEEWTVEGA